MLNYFVHVLLFIYHVRFYLIGFLYLYHFSFYSIYWSALNVLWLGVNLAICRVVSSGFCPKMARFYRRCSGLQLNYTKVLSR